MRDRRIRRLARDDGGNAIVVVMLVVALITGLAVTATALAVSNTNSAERDRQGGIALDAADAGVAAGIQFLRTGANSINCPESSLTYNSGTGTWSTSAGCAGAWNGPGNAQNVAAGQNTYSVWISRVAKAAPPTTRETVFRIRSKGSTGPTTAGIRQVEATVVARPFTYPVGIYADAVVAVGTADVANETIFSTGCISGVKHTGSTGTDLWYGGRAGIMTTGGVTASNGTCTAANDVLNNAQKCYGYGNTEFPVSNQYGGPQGSPSSCYNLTTTKFTTADLQATFGLTPRGLQPQQYAALKEIAKSQGQYYTTASYTAPNPALYPNAVMYFKLPAGTEVNLNSITGYGTSVCGTRSVVIVIEGGDARINSNADIVGALFVPDGTLRGNGNSTFTGTVFTKNLDKFNGTAMIQLLSCWVDNFPLLNEFRVSDYRQIDR